MKELNLSRKKSLPWKGFVSLFDLKGWPDGRGVHDKTLILKLGNSSENKHEW
jgi:hypothetical protein